MRYIKQFFIILAVSFLGEAVRAAIPLSIPASVYGMVILFLLLKAGIIKAGQIKETAGFLIEAMPVMFLPAAVGLMDSWGELSPMLLPVLLATVATTVLVMVVSGRVTQQVMESQCKKGGG